MLLQKSIARPRQACAALMAATLLTLLGCSGREEPARPAQRPPEVGVITVQPRSLVLKTELTGRTVAAQTAEIRPQVSGIVRQRLFIEGAIVRTGQALYQIDPDSYRAEQARTAARVARAEAVVQAAHLRAVRQQELLQAEAGSRQDAEDAQAVLAQAQADLKTARAELETARIALARTRIVSPITGRVDTSQVTPGALVTANQAAALTTVQQLDPMWVDIPQSSGDVLRLRRQVEAGQVRRSAGRALAIRLVLEDGSVYRHTGELRVSGVTVNAGTGAVTLRASVPNPQGLLLPGMVVRALLDQAEVPDAILVPQAAISRTPRGDAAVLLVGADGRAERRAVKLAEAVDGRWRVAEGLRAGERLIVEGLGKVRPGQIVQAVAAGSPPARGKPRGAVAAAVAER